MLFKGPFTCFAVRPSVILLRVTIVKQLIFIGATRSRAVNCFGVFTSRHVTRSLSRGNCFRWFELIILFAAGGSIDGTN